MKYKEIKIYTASSGIDIVSGFLIARGIRGVMIEDAADFNEFLEDTTIHWDYIEENLMYLKEVETSVTFYLPDNIQGMESFQEIKRELKNLKAENPSVELGRLEVASTEVNEEDWANAWKKYYHPVKVGEHLVVVPSWEEFSPKQGEIPVILDPGMAFGTGTHETTRLCMQLLDKAVTPQTELLDIGTGSGILSITSLLLGAKSAVGVDIDEIACKIAGENAALNHVENRLSLYCSDLTQNISGIFDIVCANIVADVIIRLAEKITHFMRKDSILLVSGIIEERKDEVLQVLNSFGLNLEKTLSEHGWVAMQLRYSSF